jgi:hypothetical protein
LMDIKIIYKTFYIMLRSIDLMIKKI